jgi:hypothetical protein
MRLKILSKALTITLWASTLVVALCWLFWKEAPFDPEPITVVLGLLSTAVTALLAEYGNRLEQEEFSLPYALAYGYINNFIEPLITQLLRTAKPPVQPKVYIYIPQNLSELSAGNIDRTLAHMRLRNFRDEVVNLELKEGRARDILTIQTADNRQVYFDFPNTLLSLNSLIDYKLESGRNQFSDKAREEMAAAYILKFREIVNELVHKKNLAPYVFFVDKELNFAFD